MALSKESVAILEATHSCRNAALHHDRHRPNVLFAAGALLFTAVTELLEITFGQSGRSFTTPTEWPILSRLGISKPFEPYGSAIRTLAGALLARIGMAVPQALDHLGGDARNRVSELAQSIATDFPGLPLFSIDALLREQEFWLSFNNHEVSGDLRHLHYDIVAGKTVQRDAYAATNLIYTETVNAAFHLFAETVSTTQLNKLADEARALREADDVPEFLKLYARLDLQLQHYETVFHEAVLELDRRQGE